MVAKPVHGRKKQAPSGFKDEVVETFEYTDDKEVWTPNVQLDAETAAKEWQPDTWVLGELHNIVGQ